LQEEKKKKKKKKKEWRRRRRRRRKKKKKRKKKKRKKERRKRKRESDPYPPYPQRIAPCQTQQKDGHHDRREVPVLVPQSSVRTVVCHAHGLDYRTQSWSECVLHDRPRCDSLSVAVDETRKSSTEWLWYVDHPRFSSIELPD
jgi:hypothetical protein